MQPHLAWNSTSASCFCCLGAAGVTDVSHHPGRWLRLQWTSSQHMITGVEFSTPDQHSKMFRSRSISDFSVRIRNALSVLILASEAVDFIYLCIYLCMYV